MILMLKPVWVKSKTAELEKGMVEGKGSPGKVSRKEPRTQAFKGLALLIRSEFWDSNSEIRNSFGVRSQEAD